MISIVDNDYLMKRIESYTIISKLGDGGFAHVYLAQQNFPHGHLVAIKLLNPKYLKSKQQQLFLQEAQFLQELEYHPYVLPILDQGEYEGVPYIVVEYASKGTLRERINNPPSMTVDEVLTILNQVGDALHAVHRHNIVHSDLKPENILFNENDNALLADFGIAIRLGLSEKYYGHPRGTYAYMAPEQFDGIFTREGDQYALGCIAYELFIGKHPLSHTDPFNPRDQKLMRDRHKNAELLPIKELNVNLPDNFGQTILKALAKKPSERHISVEAFIQSLLSPASYTPKSLSWVANIHNAQQASIVSHENLQRSITSFPKKTFASFPILEASCKISRSEERSSNALERHYYKHLLLQSIPKNVDQLNSNDFDQLQGSITENNLSDGDTAEPDYQIPGKKFLDLQLPKIFQGVLLPLLQKLEGLELFLEMEEAEDEVGLLDPILYTVIKNKVGNVRALLHISREYLQNPRKVDLSFIDDIVSAFDRHSTLIIISDLSELPALQIKDIVEKKWMETRGVKGSIVPWKYIKELGLMSPKRRDYYLTNLLELWDLQVPTRVSDADIGILEGAIERYVVTYHIDMRKTLLSVGLNEVAANIDIRGSASEVTGKVIKLLNIPPLQLHETGHVFLGLLLCYFLKQENFPPEEGNNIKKIIRKYRLGPSSCGCSK